MRRGTSVGWSGLCALVLAAGLGAGLALAQEDHAGFYRNQTIRIVVNATGGGFDAHARTVARHLGRHIPGHPSVVVESMHGAGGLVAVNYLSKAARPDGLTIAHFSGDLLLGEVLGRPGIEFDARKLAYLGAGSSELIACAFSKASGITSLDRWVSAGAPVKMGGTAPGSNGDNATRILKAALGLPIQLVSGYKGTAAIRLAVESGELAGACFNWVSMRTAWQHALDAGEVIAVLQLTSRPFPDLPGLPLVTELVKTDDARRLVNATILRAGGLGAAVRAAAGDAEGPRPPPSPGVPRHAPRPRVPRRRQEGQAGRRPHAGGGGRAPRRRSLHRRSGDRRSAPRDPLRLAPIRPAGGRV